MGKKHKVIKAKNKPLSDMFALLLLYIANFVEYQQKLDKLQN